MWSLTERKLSLIAIIILALALTAGCTGQPEKTLKSTDEKPSENDGLALFRFDLILKQELIFYDENTGNIRVYLRLKHNLMPLKPEKNILIGTIRLIEFDPLGDVYSVRVAPALSPSELTIDDIKKLAFKNPEIRPVPKMLSGFNEVDIYGSGTFDAIVELTFKPRETIASDDEAFSYIKDLAHDKKAGFAYAITIDRENNKQLYRKVEVLVPEQVFSSDKEIYLFSVDL